MCVSWGSIPRLIAESSCVPPDASPALGCRAQSAPKWTDPNRPSVTSTSTWGLPAAPNLALSAATPARTPERDTAPELSCTAGTPEIDSAPESASTAGTPEIDSAPELVSAACTPEMKVSSESFGAMSVTKGSSAESRASSVPPTSRITGTPARLASAATPALTRAGISRCSITATARRIACPTGPDGTESPAGHSWLAPPINTMALSPSVKERIRVRSPALGALGSIQWNGGGRACSTTPVEVARPQEPFCFRSPGGSKTCGVDGGSALVLVGTCQYNVWSRAWAGRVGTRPNLFCRPGGGRQRAAASWPLQNCRGTATRG
eukprot:scaffold6320_cov126-Isochrysis_galbana.AAC.6